MLTTNAIPKPSADDQGWVFLVEHSINDFTVANERGDDGTAGSLLPTVRDLGIPPECLKKMVRTLIEFAGQMIVPFNQGKAEYPLVIRLFCQKKLKDETRSEKTSRHLDTDHDKDHASFIHHPGSKMNGGWGYFLIERGGDVSASGSETSQKTVDLYLYKEGK